MAVYDPATSKEDWAFFEVWQEPQFDRVVYRRIAGPKDVFRIGNAVAFLDANIFENEIEVAKNPKVTRAPMPGSEAVALAMPSAKFVHKLFYFVKYA